MGLFRGCNETVRLDNGPSIEGYNYPDRLHIVTIGNIMGLLHVTKSNGIV